MAKLMNMSRQGVSHWENDRALPDAETLKKLSQVLNFNFEEIESAGEENPVETPAEETPEVLEAAKPERKQHKNHFNRYTDRLSDANKIELQKIT